MRSNICLEYLFSLMIGFLGFLDDGFLREHGCLPPCADAGLLWRDLPSGGLWRKL